jgi:hypothetical protein
MQLHIGVNDRIKDFIRSLEFLKKQNAESQKIIAKLFDDYFRNGLIHEGRIKNFGQFSYDYNWLLNFENDFKMINPSLLLTEVDLYCRNYIQKIASDKSHYSLFITKLK